MHRRALAMQPAFMCYTMWLYYNELRFQQKRDEALKIAFMILHVEKRVVDAAVAAHQTPTSTSSQRSW